MKKLEDYNDGELDIVNAVITSASITFDRDIFLSCWLTLDFGGSGQGYGGYVLGGAPGRPSETPFPAADHANQPNLAALWISHMMVIGGVDDFSKLEGKVIRVAKTRDHFSSEIIGVGHVIKDMWFFQEKELADIRQKQEEKDQ